MSECGDQIEVIHLITTCMLVPAKQVYRFTINVRKEDAAPPTVKGKWVFAVINIMKKFKRFFVGLLCMSMMMPTSFVDAADTVEKDSKQEEKVSEQEEKVSFDSSQNATLNVGTMYSNYYYSFEDTVNGAKVVARNNDYYNGTNDGEFPKVSSWKNAIFGEGKYGKALYLDGTYGLRLPVTGLGSSYTIAFWVKAGAMMDNYQPVVFFGSNLVGNNTSSKKYATITKLDSGSPSIYSIDNNNNVSYESANYENVITTSNGWQHVIVTVEDSYYNSYNSTVKTYVNGVLKTTGRIAKNVYDYNANTFLGIDCENTLFRGYIDELQFYSTAVTEQQAKEIYKYVPEAFRKDPELNVDTSTIMVDGKGVSSVKSLQVNTNGTGGYTVNTDGNSWIRLGKAGTGAGTTNILNMEDNEIFYLSFDENTSSDVRRGTITITHAEDTKQKKQIQVEQQAKEAAPILTTDVSTIKVDANGKSDPTSVKVDTGKTGGFTVEVTNGSWIKLSLDGSSSNTFTKLDTLDSGIFYVFFDKNTSSTARSGRILVTHKKNMGVRKEIQVNQEGKKASVLKTSVSTISVNASGVGSTSYVTVDTNHTGGFTVSTSDSSWIKIGTSSSGSTSNSLTFKDNGTFYIFFDKSLSTSGRTGTITVTHEDGTTKQNIQVKQEDFIPILDVGSTEKRADNKGVFYSNYVSVNTKGTGSCTVDVNDCDWLRVSLSETSDFSYGFSSLTCPEGSGFYLLAMENTGSERVGTITIKHSAGSLSKTVQVTQEGKGGYLDVSELSVDFLEPKKAISNKITVEADADTKWQVTSKETWIHLTKSSSVSASSYPSLEGKGEEVFYIIVDKNISDEAREGYVVVSSTGLEEREIYVHQESKPDILDIDVRVKNKTFKKGNTTKILVSLPEGMYQSDIKSIKCRSSKKRVAVVKNRTIKGKNKGTAKISVQVVMKNKESHVWKFKITVDKRKVRIKAI